MAINEPNMRLMKRDDLDAVVAIDTLVSKQERRQYYERKIDSIVTNSNNINTCTRLDGSVFDQHESSWCKANLYLGELE